MTLTRKYVSRDEVERIGFEAGQTVEHDPETGDLYVVVGRTEYVAKSVAW